MKNKIMALLVAFSMAGYMSAIEVNENLSINGFVDGSYNSTDADVGDDTQSLGLDEVEVDFLFNAGGVSAELHLDNDNDTGDRNFDIEQVHMSYSLENGLSVTLGRFGTNLGLEREDPGGLYTYSRAYGGSPFDLGNIDARGTQEGVRFGYGSDTFGLALSATNASADSGNLETDDLDIEVSINYSGIENLSISLGAFIDNEDGAESDVMNVAGTYTSGKALIGFEYTEIDTSDPGAGTDSEREGYLLLVDYDVSDKLGVALRYSSYEDATNDDVDTFTIAPNYAITESLGAILEYSDIDGKNTNSELLAVELLFTF